ncbi:MAG: hypothetical protein JWO82_420 [Akkermansiaceae bacterium]|nr:hypothetical protein [Akkermansiaceae bacterium]
MLKAIALQIEKALKARFNISDAESVHLHDLVISEGEIAWQGWARYEVGLNGKSRSGVAPGAVRIRIHKNVSHAATLGPMLQFFRQD